MEVKVTSCFKSDFPYYKELLIKERLRSWDQILSFKRFDVHYFSATPLNIYKITIYHYTIETKLIHFHRISKNGGHGGGGSPLLIETYICTYILVVSSMYNRYNMNMPLVCTSKNIWAELSYEFGPSCLINLG